MLNSIPRQKLKHFLPRPVCDALFNLKYLGKKKVPNHDIYVRHITQKHGIEIGGPSTLFRTSLPLYQSAQRLDGVNFSQSTVWEGEIKEGLTYNFFGNKKGTQFISDGSDLSQIKDDTYDFVLSSNCLEHIANPLKALSEWKRILKNDGHLILVLPNKASNFDHRRPTTSFDHLLEDFNSNMPETDLTHLDEILALHDLSRDPPAGDAESFKRRSLDNFSNRTLHHHVFDLDVMTEMVEFLGFDAVQKDETSRDFI